MRTLDFVLQGAPVHYIYLSAPVQTWFSLIFSPHSTAQMTNIVNELQAELTQLYVKLFFIGLFLLIDLPINQSNFKLSQLCTDEYVAKFCDYYQDFRSQQVVCKPSLCMNT